MFRKHLESITFGATALYLLFGLVWVYVSDEILPRLAPDTVSIIHLSIAKGWLFVCVTAALLYCLISRATRAIRQSHDFYLKILEEFPALIWRSGTDARCNYLNRAWLTFTGRTLEEEMGDGWAEGVLPEDRDRCVKGYLAAFSARQSFVLEYRLRRHDGEYRWIVDYGKPYYDLDGTFAGYIGSCHDITERRQAETALQQSEQRFRQLTENTSDWLWEVDDRMRYVYTSPKVAELLGVEPADLLGKSPLDLMPPDEAQRLKPALDELLRNPRPFKALENVNVHRNGTLVVMETSGVLIHDAEGRFAGYRGIDRDITDRKAAEGKVNSLNEELMRQAGALERANLELEAFSYTVSHDLRTPLARISLGCQVIMEVCGDGISPECRRALQEIYGSTEQMDRLISSLLDLSRVSHRKLCLETIDLSAMCRLIAAELRLGEPDRQASFVIADGIEALGDENLLNTLLTNLLGNAWKYTRSREMPVVEFGTLESSGERVYFVRDNGIGFDMSQADKIFSPFQRLSGTGEYEGHGIGLATVERIVNRHGGRVWAEAAPEEGSTFYFTLKPEP